MTAVAVTAELFRAVNDRIRELERFWAGEHDFVCECSDESCVEVIRMTSEEYEALRAKPTQFAMLPGHEVHPGGALPNARYVVVNYG
jgi:hypothetical protein